ncbi:MAG TPA: VWA domain-containing protein, partial [Pyrinomonadaceae bacterium]|nr:VWA domain-containing protein [Pyrinomonadaceae bacterium]
SHKIDVSKKGETSATVTFESNSDPSDFQLFYGLSNGDFGMSLLTYREPGKDGYFLLELSPKDKILDSELINKDIVFVIDTSGSMADEGKMDKARAGLLFGIRGLREGDRFNVISFAGEEHLMKLKLTAANEQGKRRGEEFVKKLSPSGGTNINDALKAALRQFDSSDRPKMLVFMTDGLPTVGESDVDKILKNASETKVTGLHLFTFGVGYDVNTRLLDKLASENSGVADYIEPKENLEVKVSNFFTKVNSPVLTNLNLDFGAVRTDMIYPRTLSDLFKGTQLTLVGRYKNDGDVRNAVLRLTGKAGDDTRSFDYNDLDFPQRAESNDFLPRLWATRRVGWLVEQIRNNGENKELRDEIVDLGTRYGIVTPYTSYLATDGSERQFTIDGRDFRNAPAPKAMAQASGADAVALSKKSRSLKEEIRVNEKDDELVATGAVKKVGTKTFYLQNGIWTDSEITDNASLPETNLKFASEQYFDLVAKEPELARFFALGEEVAVVWKGRVYRITK